MGKKASPKASPTKTGGGGAKAAVKAVAAAAVVPKAVAPPPAPAAPVAPVQQFSATNGKWTIGGLNQVDVYKLILNNGLA